MELTANQRLVFSEYLTPMTTGKSAMLIEIEAIGIRSSGKVFIGVRVRSPNKFPTMPMYIDDFKMILRLPEPPAEFELPAADTPKHRKDLQGFLKQHLKPAPELWWPLDVDRVKEALKK